MAITIRGMAQVQIPKEYLQEVLGMYVHTHRDGSFIRNYRFSSTQGLAYLPLNADKLRYVSRLLGEAIVDERSPGEALRSPFVLNPSFEFRPHQVEPSAELFQLCRKENFGLLSAGCGNGKTVVMTWVAGMLGCKTLIIVDMGSLLSQWEEAFELVWNKQVQILDGKTSAYGDVCITTFQFLHANPELLLDLRERFGTLLLDEFHTACSDTRREVLLKMNNKYRIGCTASLMKKGYSDDVLTDFVSGSIVVMKDQNAMKPEIEFVSTGRPFYSNNPDDWGKTMSALAKDTKRNRQIAEDAIAAVRAGRRVLVIGITQAGLKEIEAYLKECPECKPIVYIGSTTLKQDRQLREDLASGKINVIMTVKKADKGLDLPSLDYLLLGRPANNESFVIQISGRILPMPASLLRFV